MKPSALLACAGVASMVLSACTPQQQKQQPQQQSPTHVNFFGSGSYPITACPNTVPKPTGAEKYILTLSSTFQLRKAQAAKSGHPEHPNGGHAQKTRLDIATDLKAGESATVMIVLADGTLEFQAYPNALRGGDADAPLIFCDVAMNGNTLTFTVHRDQGGPTYATYNLGLIAKEPMTNFELPVFIDPEVQNNG